MQPQTVLVTGASSGIGRASAELLAQDGHRVLVAARRERLLEELAARTPGVLLPIPLDVTSEQSVAGLRDHLQEFAPDGLDAVVNAAGYALSGPIETLTADAVRSQFETNLFGILRVASVVLPGMRARRTGRIVNVSSVVGRVAFPGMGIYSASKHALEAASDALRMELRDFGIDVVLVEPGFVKTDIANASEQAAQGQLVQIDDYARMQRAVDDYLKDQISKAADPASVARVIRDAVTARRPSARYVVPRSGTALISLLNGVPTRVADRMKTSQSKVRA